METTSESEKAKMIEKLQTVDFVFGTNDGGSTIEVMTEAHTAVNYREHIDKLEEAFNIKQKVETKIRCMLLLKMISGTDVLLTFKTKSWSMLLMPSSLYLC